MPIYLRTCRKPYIISLLEELAVMKAHAFNNRSEPNDRSDLVFTLRKMSDEGMQFENLDEEYKDVLYELAQQADQVDGDLVSRLLASMEESSV